MRPLRRATHVFLALLLALPVGDVGSAPATGTIQGVVRLEGRPLSGVTVAFIELQSGSVVRAVSSADGGFSTVAPTGEYAVTTESQAGLAVGQAPVKVAVADGRVASANVELVAVAAAVTQESNLELREGQEMREAMTEAEIHRLGVHIVREELQQEGWIVLTINVNPKVNPQIIARKNGTPGHVLVRTARHPNKGAVENDHIIRW